MAVIRFFGKKRVLASFFLLSVFLIPPFSADAAFAVKSPPSSGLIGWWTLDGADVTDKVYDRSGRGRQGYFIGGATTSAKTAGTLGQALKFDGTNNYVAFTDIAEMDSRSAFTISAWVKANSLAGDTTIAGKHASNVGLALQTGGSGYGGGDDIAFAFDGLNFVYTNSNIVPLGEWIHVVGTFDNSLGTGKHKIYVNGVSQSVSNFNSPDSVTSTGPSTASLEIGRLNSAGRYWNGQIDDVRVYDRALSYAEVQRLYSATQSVPIVKSPTSNGLVGWWTFDSVDVTDKIYDRSRTGNHLYLSGNSTSSAKINGALGQAFNFDGSDDVARKANPTGLPVGRSARTVAYWIKPSQACTAGGGNIFHYGGGGQNFILTCFTSGLTYLFTDGINSDNNITISGSEIPPANVWSHVAFTFDGASGWVYYLNGARVKSGSFGTTIDTVAAPTIINIGDRTDVAQANFPGGIDDVRVYNRALTGVEVQQLYGATQGVSIMSAAQTNSITSGLVGYWPFNGMDIAGVTAYDRSGQGNNGTLTNGPLRVIGKVGQGLQFGGSSTRVAAPAINVSRITIGAWVKFNSGAYGGIVNRWQGSPSQDSYLFEASTTTIAAAWRPSTSCFASVTTTISPPLPTGSWVHLGFSYDGTTPFSYVNGVRRSMTSTSCTGTLQSTSETTAIGNRSGGPTVPFDGSIDEVRIYNRVLSDAEMKRLYNLGR